MVENNNDNVFEHYKNVRTSLSGLLEILKINLTEKDFYYQAGIDNLKAIHESVIKLLNENLNPRQVRMKIREIKFDEIDEFVEIESVEEALPF